jgi:hypothetical protein
VAANIDDLVKEIRGLREDLSRYDHTRSMPRGVVRNPVTISLVRTLPVAGAAALVIDPLYKVKSGFTFFSTYFGVMVDTEQVTCDTRQTPLGGFVPVDNRIALTAQLAGVGAATQLPNLEIEVKLSGNTQKNFNVNPTSWAYGSSDPAEFVTQAFQNDVYSVVINNRAFTFGQFAITDPPHLNQQIIIRLDGWLESIHVKERFK